MTHAIALTDAEEFAGDVRFATARSPADAGHFVQFYEDEGFLVEVARDGREALARFASSDLPALVLLDLAMPAMDGRAVLGVLEANVRWARVPVVVMTASDPTPETVKRR